MSKSTTTSTSTQSEPIDAARVLAMLVEQEIDSLLTAHGEMCKCTFCYESRRMAYFVGEFHEVVPFTGANEVSHAAVMATVQNFLEQELGESCEPGHPPQKWTDEYWQTDAAERILTHRDYPPAAMKLAVLGRALEGTLADCCESCECGDGRCHLCQIVLPYAWLVNHFACALDCEIYFQDKDCDALVADVRKLLCKDEIADLDEALILNR